MPEPTVPAELPWRCFQCDEVFHTRAEAREHFGLDGGELPACVEMLTEGEKALVNGRREWRDRAMAAEAECGTLGHRINAEGWELRRFGKDVRTVDDAWHLFETEQGQRLSAEEKVRFLVERLRLYGVPWQPLPHDDRTPGEILGHVVDESPQPAAEEEEVVSGLLALHAKLTARDPLRAEPGRPLRAEVSHRDSDVLLSAMLILEKARLARAAA